MMVHRAWHSMIRLKSFSLPNMIAMRLRRL